MITNNTRFDPDTHTYFIGRCGTSYAVPSVTQVMNEILGHPYQAAEWHLQRGRAVHACCAFIARRQAFKNDPQIDGQVAACRMFLADMHGEILQIEQAYYSTRYMFAGTLDLVIRIGKETFIVDYKASLTKQAEIQLGAYGLLANIRRGIAVQLNEDGTFKTSEVYDLRRPGQEFLSLLSAYNTKARLGMIRKEQGEADGI